MTMLETERLIVRNFRISGEALHEMINQLKETKKMSVGEQT